MKKTLACVVAAAGLLFVSAAPAQASAPTYTNKDNMYYRAVVSEEPSLRAVGKGLLIKSAKTTCRALRSGVDPYDLYDMALQSGLTEDEFIALLAGALTFYCEDQMYKIE